MTDRIYIKNDQKKVTVDAALRALIRKAIRTTLKYENYKRVAEVSVTLCDDEKIRVMNYEFRGLDKPTDVLSFPMFDEDYGDGEDAVLGDIVISLERASAQALEYGHSFERETAFLCVHSVLHLLGYDHEEGKAEESEMFAKQSAVLTILGLER